MSRRRKITIIATSIVSVVGFTGYGLPAWSQTIELRDELTKLPPHVKAVLYAIPLVIMDVTREESLAGQARCLISFSMYGHY